MLCSREIAGEWKSPLWREFPKGAWGVLVYINLAVSLPGLWLPDFWIMDREEVKARLLRDLNAAVVYSSPWRRRCLKLSWGWSKVPVDLDEQRNRTIRGTVANHPSPRNLSEALRRVSASSHVLFSVDRTFIYVKELGSRYVLLSVRIIFTSNYVALHSIWHRSRSTACATSLRKIVENKPQLENCKVSQPCHKLILLCK